MDDSDSDSDSDSNSSSSILESSSDSYDSSMEDEDEESTANIPAAAQPPQPQVELAPTNNRYGEAGYNQCLKQPPNFSIVNFAICFRHLVDSYTGSDCTIEDRNSFLYFLNNMFGEFSRTDNTFLKLISDVWNYIKEKTIKEIFSNQDELNNIRANYRTFLRSLALTFKVDREHDLNGKRGTAPGIDPPMDVRLLVKQLNDAFNLNLAFNSDNKIDAKFFARDTTTGKINKILREAKCNEQVVYMSNLTDTAKTKHSLEDRHYLIGCIDDCNNENNKNIVENFVLNLCNLFYLSFQCELIYTVAKTQTRFKESDTNPTFSGDYTEQANKLTRCIYYKYVLQSSKFDYSESGRITIRTTIIQDYAGSIPIKEHIGDCDLEGTNLFSVKSVIAFAKHRDKKDSFKTCFKKILTKISYSVDDANKIFLLFAATHKGSGDFNQVGENVIFTTINYIKFGHEDDERVSNFIKVNGCITATSDTYLYVIALLIECAILLATPLEHAIFMSAWNKFKDSKLISVHKALVDISIYNKIADIPQVEDCSVV